MTRPSISTESLYAALLSSVGEVFEELLSDVRLEATIDAPDPSVLAASDVCALAIRGQLSGTLAIACDPEDVKHIARTILGANLDDDSLDVAAESALSDLEESAIRELCNRIGAAFVAQMPEPEDHEFTFTAFFRKGEVCSNPTAPIQLAYRVKVVGRNLTLHLNMRWRDAADPPNATPVRTRQELRELIEQC